MNDLVKSQAEQMKALAAATQTIQNENPGGLGFLKLNKVGYWVFGEDSLDVEEDSLWAVNPASFGMGFIAWPAKGMGAPLDEKMASIYGPAVVESTLPPVESKWQRQVAMMLVCLNGEDEGEQVQYKASTVGGSKAFGTLLQEVLKHLQSGKAGTKTVPVLELETDSYTHPEHGEVFTPVFTIKKWIENTGFDAPVEEEEEEPEVEAPPAKKKRATRPKKKPAPPVEEIVEDDDEEDEPEPEPEPEATSPRRRRRRK